jgi:hypothetical protein
MNTYGLMSVNNNTFNLRWHTNYSYPKEARDVIVTCLRLHNATLNVLGYIARTSRVSGCIRMISGFLICATTLAIGDRKAERGVIIQHYYDEALLTGIAQMFRGAMEAFVPHGKVINATLDVIATIVNLATLVAGASVCQGCMGYDVHGPHPEPDYPLPLKLLYLI